MNVIDVGPDNVEQTGFFCKMSQRRSAGYRRKLAWLEARFTEGLEIKLLDLSEGGRGFIEYIPGEYAWRPVEAIGYTFIHRLWIVGKSKGRGYAGRLLDECVESARRQGRCADAVRSLCRRVRRRAGDPPLSAPEEHGEAAGRLTGGYSTRR